MLKQAYDAGYQAAFDKLAGGPGSGVTGDNTEELDLPRSPYVSVGSRKDLLTNMHYRKLDVPVESIKYSCQSRYVPKKLQVFFDNPSLITEKPVDLLEVDEGGSSACYHIIDGNHRVAAARRLGIKTLNARVRKKAKKTYGKKST